MRPGCEGEGAKGENASSLARGDRDRGVGGPDSGQALDKRCAFLGV